MTDPALRSDRQSKLDPARDALMIGVFTVGAARLHEATHHRHQNARKRHGCVPFALVADDGATSRGDRLAPRDRLACMRLALASPIALDSGRDNRATGAFIVIDFERNARVAAGTVNAERGVVRQRPTV
jgi:sulfate adenylyltransferase subunit 1 (EFTu-like GTPase family)